MLASPGAGALSQPMSPVYNGGPMSAPPTVQFSEAEMAQISSAISNMPIVETEPELEAIAPETETSDELMSIMDDLNQSTSQLTSTYTSPQETVVDAAPAPQPVILSPRYSPAPSQECAEAGCRLADTTMTMPPLSSSPSLSGQEPDDTEAGDYDNISSVVTVTVPLLPQPRASIRHEYEKDEEADTANKVVEEDTRSVKIVRDSESRFKEVSGYMKEKWAGLRLSKSGTEKKIVKKKKYVPQKKEKKGYSHEDIALAATILYSSRRVYKLLKEKKILQLPSMRTVYRRLQHFNCHPGFNKQLFRLLEMKLATLKEKDRVLGISFDEMHLEQKYSWSPLLRRLFGKHKV